MQTLEKRVSALEQAAQLTDRQVNIIIRAPKPGHLDAEAIRLTTNEGQEWERLPGETERGMIERASLEVKRNASGIAMLFTHDGLPDDEAQGGGKKVAEAKVPTIPA